MKRVLILIAVCILFSACSKEEILDKVKNTLSDGKTLSKVQYWNNTTKTATTITEVVYTGSNVKEVKLYKTDASVWYTYDKVELLDGKVTKVEGKHVPDNSTIVWDFKYNSAGKIIESKRTTGNQSKTYFFTYDATGRLASSMNDDSSLEYTYEGTAKNPASIKEFNNYTFNTTTIKHKYDAKKNPYTGVPSFLFYMNNGEFYENNLIEVDRGNLIIKYNYEYNPSGFATTKRDANSGGGLNFLYQ